MQTLEFFTDFTEATSLDPGQSTPDPKTPGFTLIDGGDDGPPIPMRCRWAMADLAPGGYLAIALPVSSGGRMLRVAGLLSLPIRIAATERLLVRCGAMPMGCYGVSPDLRQPTVVYKLRGGASRYAERHLLYSQRTWPAAVVCGLLRTLVGCDPSLGAVLVIGKRS
jgi:hypothetical protein